MCRANGRSRAVFVGRPRKREGKTEQMSLYLNMCWANRRPIRANRRPISGIKHYIEGVCVESYIDIVLEFNTI